MLTLPLNQSLELPINRFLWRHTEQPHASAVLEMRDSGLYVRFKVQEQDGKAPLTTALKQQEPMLMVCQDSAVELFLAFADSEQQSLDHSFKPMLEHCLYLNIEINSKGICYAKHGHSRKGRTAFTPEEIASLQIASHDLGAGQWEIELEVPRALIARLATYDSFGTGHCFAFNLYKISETKEHEHFVSYHPIDEEAVTNPNFHLPQYFELCNIA